MAKADRSDPYAGNLLVAGLGPILSFEERLTRLTTLPPIPTGLAAVPRHVRLHQLLALRDLHIPGMEGVRIAETIDVMVRQSYRYRDPARAATWATMCSEPSPPMLSRAPAMAAMVVGHSGVGKTESILRALGCYPNQVIQHDTFPKLIGAHHQLAWLTVDVPASGRLVDLARNLMIAWDVAFARLFPGQPPRFAAALARAQRDGSRMLDEWRHVAAAHFLGALHLDEVQNFFKLATLSRRRSSSGRGDVPTVDLSLIEDQMIKAVLILTNTWQIPLILSGTPDGVGALTKRLSNAQRFVASGYHKVDEFQSPEDERCRMFLDQLGRYQYLRNHLPIDAKYRALMVELTAGIPRLIVALWIAAQRVALERSDDTLRLSDIRKAADTYLAPIAPAVAALRSKDPRLMHQYEDLMPRDDAYWAQFWAGTSGKP